LVFFGAGATTGVGRDRLDQVRVTACEPALDSEGAADARLHRDLSGEKTSRTELVGISIGQTPIGLIGAGGAASQGERRFAVWVRFNSARAREGTSDGRGSVTREGGRRHVVDPLPGRSFDTLMKGGDPENALPAVRGEVVERAALPAR
jgi:hypothetical protein